MSDSDEGDILLMGRVVDAHGLSGELKVAPETDAPERFEALSEVWIGAASNVARSYALQHVRLQPSRYGITVVLRVEGITDRTAAERLKGLSVYAQASQLPELAEDEVYVHDLIGLTVVTEAGEQVGHIRDVLDLPAQQIYVVARPGAPDVMVPAVPAFIVDIDARGGRLTIRPIEGLLE